MTFPRVVLFLSAVAFAGFGVWGLVAPAEMIAMVEVTAATPTARAELRSFYGGLQLGIAGFFLVCLARRDRVAVGLLASTILIGSIAVARGTSGAEDGPVARPILYLLATEVTAAVLSAVGWRMAAAAAPDSR